MEKKRIILLTGNELRHQFFRKFLSNKNDLHVVSTYCESSKGGIFDIVDTDLEENKLRRSHLISRNLSEKDFFELYCNNIDNSKPMFINKGEINDIQHVKKIIEINPDLIISYGCSIIRSELLEIFSGRFINIHLGLSPYYRGSGTNFWPIVNNEYQFIGTTFMHIDKGIDTGKVIHQIRAKIYSNDSIHQIGNRLIKDSVIECAKLISSFHKIKPLSVNFNKSINRYYKKVDFTEDSIKLASKNNTSSNIDLYLNNKKNIDAQYPIVSII
jgi:folate-dependent phosphoribosylglycinamide formyltransferase PurN